MEQGLKQNRPEMSFSDKRFGAIMGGMGLLTYGLSSREEIGRENLEKASRLSAESGTGLVVASSHGTNVDMGTNLAALSRELPVVVTYRSTNTEDSQQEKGMNLLGREHFYEIPTKWLANETPDKLYATPVVPRPFNPLDYVKLIEQINLGRSAVTAAHNPTFDTVRPDGSVAPLRSGLLVPFLAFASGGKTGNHVLVTATRFEGQKDNPELYNEQRAPSLSWLLRKKAVAVGYSELVTPNKSDIDSFHDLFRDLIEKGNVTDIRDLKVFLGEWGDKYVMPELEDLTRRLDAAVN